MKAKVDLSEYQDRKLKNLHFIGVATPGFTALDFDTQFNVVRAFMNAPKGDWFYCIVLENGQKIFVAENGESGYTAMLPEEY